VWLRNVIGGCGSPAASAVRRRRLHAVDRRHADCQRDGAEWRTVKTLSTSGPRLSTVADAHPRTAKHSVIGRSSRTARRSSAGHAARLIADRSAHRGGSPGVAAYQDAIDYRVMTTNLGRCGAVRGEPSVVAISQTSCGMASVTLVVHELRCNGGRACVSISRGARNGPHRTTSQHGYLGISPGRAGACYAMASSSSTMKASSFLVAVLWRSTAVVCPMLSQLPHECQR
jgi:hypothetical protein